MRARFYFSRPDFIRLIGSSARVCVGVRDRVLESFELFFPICKLSLIVSFVFLSLSLPAFADGVPEDRAPRGRHEEARPARHLQRVRHVRPGPDPGVQGGLQHDRPEQGRLHRPRRPQGHARLPRKGTFHRVTPLAISFLLQVPPTHPNLTPFRQMPPRHAPLRHPILCRPNSCNGR